MKNIYITYDFQRLDNWHNDSRYSLQYFIDNEIPEFVSTHFPQYTQADYRGIYSLDIQDLVGDEYYNPWVTSRFAVVWYDDLSHSEAQLLAWMQDVFTFLWIQRIANQTQARSWLDTNTTLQKIDNSTYLIMQENVEMWTPAKYLHL